MKSPSLILLAISLAALLSSVVASGAAASACDQATSGGTTVSQPGVGRPGEQSVVDKSAVAASRDLAAGELADYTACNRRRPWYPIPDILPATGVPLISVGLFGWGLMAAGLVLSVCRLWRQRRSA